MRPIRCGASRTIGYESGGNEWVIVGAKCCRRLRNYDPAFARLAAGGFVQQRRAARSTLFSKHYGNISRANDGAVAHLNRYFVAESSVQLELHWQQPFDGACASN